MSRASPIRTTPLGRCEWSDWRSPGSRAKSVHACQVLRPRQATEALAMTLLRVLPSANRRVVHSGC